MKTATRQMIELALSNDATVSGEMADAIGKVLNGNVSSGGPQPDGPLLMNMTGAAKLIGVSRVTLWRMVKEGVLRPVEIMPGVFRIRRGDLHRISTNYAKYRPVRRGGCAERSRQKT